jgi:hypothetical protein
LPRLWIAAIVAAVGALGAAPAVAQASVTSSTITSWVSTEPNTPANNQYLLYRDNAPVPTLTVSGRATASASDSVNINCSYGSSPSVVRLATAVPVNGGTFTASGINFKSLVGHACQLRAVDFNDATKTTASGPEIAVSEAESLAVAGGPPNAGAPYDFYLNSTTLTGTVAWSAPGTPSPTAISPLACGGPNISLIDSSLNVGTPAVDCAGALMSDDLGAWGGRSEVQIDGHNAYDAAAAQALFAGAHPSQNLAGFPSLATAVQWDPSSGLVSSTSTESWAACTGHDTEVPTFATCPSFTPTGVQLRRVVTTSDGGRVVTMSDTWSTTDNAPHTLDLLYDDTIGTKNTVPRGYEFPGENGFTTHVGGDSVSGASAAPASILAHTDLTAPDGDPTAAFAALTFSRPPAGFRFVNSGVTPAPPSPAPSYELEEHQVLQIPAGGSTTLRYVYSAAGSAADVSALALAAQDQIQPPALSIASPADGTTVTVPTVTLAGATSAGSGIKSLTIAGQTVPIASDGSWSATVPLNPGANTITALATDGAGVTMQDQETVVYQPPPPPPPPAPAAAKCHVPRVKGMKLRAAEKSLRNAHCKVGKVKHVSSRKLARGRVTSSTPRAGRRLRAGSKIELFVSKGFVAHQSH